MILRCRPEFVEEIWGDESLGKLYGVDGEIGEVWLCSGHPERKTMILDDKGERFGWEDILKIWKFDRFPFLIKHIKTKEWLSVQVHPDDDAAKKIGEPWGKPEMWYFVKGGTLVNGLKKGALEKLKNGDRQWDSLLNFANVKSGEGMFINPGTVHAIGPEIELYEFQMTSDVTYRFYDWNRGRKTHFDEAMACAKEITAEPFVFNKLETSHFKVELLNNVTFADPKSVYLSLNSVFGNKNFKVPTAYISNDGGDFLSNGMTFKMTLP
ncbi:type I phosphomannose isomerase catalytic subunit [Athalassotoga sp.]|uniref:type I phosphomannose isomerase catalytic subunit n=1 Tax=Athalassotoga sp. TaxID=2022597 RepID=UPI003D04A7E8